MREFNLFYHPDFAGSKSKYHVEPCCASFFLRRLFNAWRDIPKLSAAMD
jgi:hypothetical protein